MNFRNEFVLSDQARKQALQSWIRAIEAIKVLDKRPNTTLGQLFNEIAGIHDAAPALLGEDGILGYRELAARSNQYARWALQQGFKAGEVVCLLMPNCPDYVAIWLGLTQVGCVVALINTNLGGDALAHCIHAAHSTCLIVAGVLLQPVLNITNLLPAEMRLWVYGETDVPTENRIDRQILDFDGAVVEVPVERQPAAQDTALLIYTSGTTGLPKAAKVTQGRLVEWSYWFAGLMGADSSDRLYNCLPMYHSIGGVVAVGSMLVAGGSVLIRQRFSVSRFWNDIVDHRCTIFQYIGELCRYLAHGAADPRETEHRLRLCCGNGLSGDVWETFQERFEIPRILEYYASTEGNVSLYNCEGRPGAIGRVPSFLAHRFPVALIRCDDTGAAQRDEAGFCIKAEADEAGEAIGRIADTKTASTQHFDGYTDATASGSKILHGVFTSGDRWYRTGDLMRKDRAGYYIFIDRLGDTFRWKGENVSTTEVAAVVSGCPGVTDAVVFGVPVPGYEGRAGMAAITTAAGFSHGTLRDHLAAKLPEYARPVFVRVCQTIEMTGTFKLKKDKLRSESLQPSADVLWIYDRSQRGFVEFDDAWRKQLADGGLRL